MNTKKITFFDNIKDAAFRKQLLQNPHSALQKAGFNVDEKMDVKVVTNTASEINLVMPVPNSDNVIPEHELEGIAAGELVIIGTVAAFSVGAGIALALAGAGVVVGWEYGVIEFNI